MFGEQLHNLWLRLQAVLNKRRQLDRDLTEELEFHLAMREQKLIEQGMAPERPPTPRRAASTTWFHLKRRAAKCGDSLRSKHSFRTCATECGCCGRIPASQPLP